MLTLLNFLEEYEKALRICEVDREEGLEIIENLLREFDSKYDIVLK